MSQSKDKKPRKKRTNYRVRTYSPEQRSAVLDVLKSNGGNVLATANQTGVPQPTVRAWARGWRCANALTLYEEKGGDLAQAAEQIAWHIAGIIPDRVHEAPLNQLAVSFGIMVDKMRILRDQPTTIGSNTTTTKDEQTERFKEIVKGMTFDERQQLRNLFERVSGRLDTGPRKVSGGS